MSEDTERLPVQVPVQSMRAYARERRKQDRISVLWDLRHEVHLEEMLGRPMWPRERDWVIAKSARKLMSGPGPRELFPVRWEE
jgi:hypothetical protein